MVWTDIERFLRAPGDILEELSMERELDAGAAVLEAERIHLENALVELAQRRKKAIDQNLRGTTTDDEMDEQIGQIILERKGLEDRLKEFQVPTAEPVEPPGADNPLFAIENTVLSPHIAGLTRECAIRMSLVAAQNALDGIDGRLNPDLVVNQQVLAPSAGSIASA